MHGDHSRSLPLEPRAKSVTDPRLVGENQPRTADILLSAPCSLSPRHRVEPLIERVLLRLRPGVLRPDADDAREHARLRVEQKKVGLTFGPRLTPLSRVGPRGTRGRREYVQ